jgi:ParB/RepB/Spo0J family partition protein
MKQALESNLQLLNVKDITPNRLISQDRDRTALATSIPKHGILQNIAVRPRPKRRAKYELIFGEGRWREAKRNGQKKIWALVRECSDLELLKLAGQENFARTNPSPIQEGQLLKQLRDLGCSTRELASEFNISVGQVVERIKLIEILPEKAKRAIESGRVAATTLEYVRSTVKDPQMQAQVFETVVQKDLDLDSTVQLVKGIQPTDEVYEKAGQFQDSSIHSSKNNETKLKTEDVSFAIEVQHGKVVLGSDGSVLVRDSENHRDRNLPEELNKAWLKLREGDGVEFSFRYRTSVHAVNSGGDEYQAHV